MNIVGTAIALTLTGAFAIMTFIVAQSENKR